MTTDFSSPLTLAEAREAARAERQEGERLAVVHRDGDLWRAKFARVFKHPALRGVAFSVVVREVAIGRVKRP